MLEEFLAERVAVDAQPGGRLELHAPAGCEHLGNQFPLHPADHAIEQGVVVGCRRGQPLLDEFPSQAVEIATPTRHGRHRTATPDGHRQQIQRDLITRRHHHAPLHHVL